MQHLNASTQCYFKSEHLPGAIWNCDVLGGEWHALQGDISTISCHLACVINLKVGIGWFSGLENVVDFNNTLSSLKL